MEYLKSKKAPWLSAFFVLFLGLGTLTQAQTAHRAQEILRVWTQEPEKILITAHRGGHLESPENSRAAIEEAIAAGAHIIELDVNQTADGELVIIHDKTVDRTTTGTGVVSEMTWAELSALPLTHRGVATEHRTITLREALSQTKDRVLVDLDFKIGTYEAAREVYRVVEELGVEDQVIFFLYDHAEMARMHRLNPRIRIMPRARSMKDVHEIMTQNLTDIIHIDQGFAGEDEALQKLRGQGIRLWANTLGSYDHLVLTSGTTDAFATFFNKVPFINIVQTDHPAKLKEFLDQKGPKQRVSTAMSEVLTRLYQTHDASALDQLSEEVVLSLLSPEEKEVLSKRYWEFEVNQPVRVSLMRDVKQSSLPFWLKNSGFQKTELEVKNRISTYEVWQKDFPAGIVSLGVNGFDKHRPVYFISLAALDEQKSGKDALKVSPAFPAQQHIDTLRVGAFTYHDWDGLLLEEVPPALQGDLLLTTIRGRAREAHLLGAFRETEHPSTSQPDQVVLTHHGDPATSISVQWRTNHSQASGEVVYWVENTTDTLRLETEKRVLEDRLLRNDRYISRFTARLKDLIPSTEYQYYVKNPNGKSETFRFRTAEVVAGDPSSPAKPFEFIWFGDTHNDAGWGETINYAHQQFPHTAFYLQSGDLVNTGLHRDDWDAFFNYAEPAFSYAPLLAVPGNHDSQDGLGAGMFRALLDYPDNGPEGFPSGLTYSFTYQNALFLMMDAASIPVNEQVGWLQTQLAESDAKWKFLIVHFPPYNEVEPYPELVQHWAPILEKHGVDMVMSGHFHYYTRSQPDSVIYLMSVGTTASREAKEPKDFVLKRHEAGNLFQHFRIDGNNLEYSVYDKKGREIDRLVVQKP